MLIKKNVKHLKLSYLSLISQGKFLLACNPFIQLTFLQSLTESFPMFFKVPIGCSFLFFTSLAALPEGFHVAAGDAKTPILEGSSLTIESGKHAIIDWQKFSIDRHETVRFLQEGSHASILNRVTGGSESAILGMLESNGRVFLINPDGLLIGPDARIETSGFIASSLDILNEDFLNGGDILFAGEGNGPIINQGIIHCPLGDVLLIAKQVKNEGKIEAPQGLASLASGTEILFKPSGSERIFIRPEKSIACELENTGSIQALAVELKSGVYATAVKSSGQIDAYGLQEEGGRIYLVADVAEIDGSILSDEVHISAREVNLLDNAIIDVSGNEGGGSVSISSFNINVAPGASIFADSYVDGNGGQIILVAENETHFHGAISARSFGKGDGGFAEVSGGSLWVSGHADLRSASGNFGTFLCDPGPILINHLSGASGPNVFGDDFINMQLGLGNFTIDTANGTLGTLQTITVNDDVSIVWPQSTTLTLLAAANILFDDPGLGTGAVISNSGSPALAINFEADGTDPGNYPGIWMKAPTTITTTSGDIVLFGRGGNMGMNNIGIFMDNGSLVQTATGIIFLEGQGGAVATVNNTGVTLINSSSLVSTGGAGSIDIIGNSNSPSSTVSAGINLLNNSQVISNGVDINLSGTSHGTGVNNDGILLGDTLVESTSGIVTLMGTSSANGDTSAGVRFTGILSKVSNTNGDISITGNSLSPSGTSNDGITLDFGSVSTSGIGSITLDGTASSTAVNDDVGVRISNGGTATTTGSGAISVTGHGDGTGTSNAGISLESGGTINSSGSGDITVLGFGSPNGSSNSYGIHISGMASSIASSGGNVDITGNGGATVASDNNYGVFIEAGGNIVSSAFGASINTVTVTGRGGDGMFFNFGVYVTGMSSRIETIDHDLSVIGIGTTGSGGSFNHGIFLEVGGTIVSNGIGLLDLNGTGGLGGSDFNFGIVLDEGFVTSAATGNIVMDGSSQGNNMNNYGVYLINSSLIFSSSSGTIDITGTGGNGTNNNYGINLQSSEIASNNGKVTLTGTGKGTGDNNYGIYQNTGAKVYSLGSALIDYFGTGSTTPGVNNNYGIFLTDSGTEIRSFGTGAINLNGMGNGTGNNNHGIFIDTSLGIRSFFSGTITLTGTGSAGGMDTNIGVLIDQSNAVETVNADIFVNGFGGGTGVTNFGIDLETSSSLVSTGSGNIIATGMGGPGTDNNYGVNINAATAITINTGSMNVTGTGGNASGVNNYGVYMVSPGSLITSTSGQILLTGTGGTGTGGAVGVFLDSGALVSSTGGSELSVTGVGGMTTGSANIGVLLTNGAEISGTGTSPVVIHGTGNGTVSDDHGVQVTGGSAILSQDGNLLVAAISNSTGDSSDGIRVDSGGEISAIGSGSLLLDGTSGTGTMDSHGIIVTDAGSEITVNNGNIIDATGTSRGTMTMNHGIYVVSSGQIAALGIGSIQLDGITSSIDIGNGVFLDGTTVSTLTGDLIVNGTSNGTGFSDAGIFVVGGTFSTTTGSLTATGIGVGIGNTFGIGLLMGQIASLGGDISLTGTARATGTGNRGIVMASMGMVTNTGDGSITLHGTGGQGTDVNYGIHIINMGTLISADSGLISLTGQGGGAGTGSDNNGIVMENGPQILNMSGGINMTGLGGIGIDASEGIVLVDPSTMVQTVSGTITMNGTGGISSGAEATGIEISNSALVESSSGNIFLTGIGGSAAAGDAEGITIRASGQVSDGSGSISLVGVGGSGVGLDAGVFISDGFVNTVSGPIGMSGVGGSGAFQNWGIALASTTGSPVVLSTDGSISMSGANGANTAEGILVLGFGAETTGAGSISLASTQGNISIGSADLPFPQPTIIDATGTGNISLSSVQDISIIGSSVAGLNAFVEIMGTGNILMIANRNINMFSAGGGFPLVLNMGPGSITLVVDNAVPKPSTSIFTPGFGSGQFNFAAGSVINASPVSQVRIYTAMPFQNTISAPINGAVFMQGPFGVNNNYEQYNIYYPGGGYIGPQFVFYYKNIFIAPPFTQTQFFTQLNQTAVNDSQLSGLLPFPYASSPFLRHQALFCELDLRPPFEEPLRCPEGVIKFEAFIFENNIY